MRINLSLNYGFFEEKEPVIISDSPLVFELNEHNEGCTYFAFARIGDITETLSIKEGIFELPEKMKIPGSLRITITMVVKDCICKRWTVEPLTLISLGYEWEAIPEMVVLNERVTEQANEISEIKKALIELKNIVNEF